MHACCFWELFCIIYVDSSLNFEKQCNALNAQRCETGAINHSAMVSFVYDNDTKVSS